MVSSEGLQLNTLKDAILEEFAADMVNPGDMMHAANKSSGLYVQIPPGLDLTRFVAFVCEHPFYADVAYVSDNKLCVTPTRVHPTGNTNTMVSILFILSIVSALVYFWPQLYQIFIYDILQK